MKGGESERSAFRMMPTSNNVLDKIGGEEKGTPDNQPLTRRKRHCARAYCGKSIDAECLVEATDEERKRKGNGRYEQHKQKLWMVLRDWKATGHHPYLWEEIALPRQAHNNR